MSKNNLFEIIGRIIRKVACEAGFHQESKMLVIVKLCPHCGKVFTRRIDIKDQVPVETEGQLSDHT